MFVNDDELLHIGTETSGRYPKGSGKDPYQHIGGVLGRYYELKKQGYSESDACKKLGISTTRLREEISIEKFKKEQRQESVIRKMLDEGHTNTAIGKELGISEGSVRHIVKKINDDTRVKVDKTKTRLKDAVDKHEFIDIGEGVEKQLGVSKEKLRAIVKDLGEEGYNEFKIYIPRLQDPTKHLQVKVLTKETEFKNIITNTNKIRNFEDWDEDSNLTPRGVAKDLKSVDKERVAIRYKEDGGADKDGVIELRRGVHDLDLGNSKYAQVRIKVGDNLYLKGMAVYSDDIPKGKDILFNTNKGKDTKFEKVLKPLSDDPTNPFGATIKPNGTRGALNIVNEEGDWDKWSTKMSSQFLSKQPEKLIKERAETTYKDHLKEYDEIRSLNNPTLRAHLMAKYSDGLERSYKDLKLKAISGTKGHVILPFTDMKPNEIYAPNFENGQKVVLLRYPHAGRFELAELTVNSKHPTAKKTLGLAKDAVGIHPSVAEKLSGADFDGDTVYVIPNNNRAVKTRDSLAGLKNFDNKQYKVPTVEEGGYKTITEKGKNSQMGMVSNLITDMTIKKANEEEISRAVRHSMVVIDAEKHNLDYKKSAKDNNIQELYKKYSYHVDHNGVKRRSSSTLLTKLDNQVEEVIDIADPKNRKLVKTGVLTKKVSLIDTVPDAHMLSSGSATESIYADYINKTRDLRNKSKLEAENTPKMKWDRNAARRYKKEVESLDQKLTQAILNAPRERQAQIQAKYNYHKILKENNYEMTKEQRKKLKTQVVNQARVNTNSRRFPVNITPEEWNAIQAGAISDTKMKQLFTHADLDQLRQYATPKNKQVTSTATEARVKMMVKNGRTQSEIAKALGLSVSTVRELLE